MKFELPFDSRTKTGIGVSIDRIAGGCTIQSALTRVALSRNPSACISGMATVSAIEKVSRPLRTHAGRTNTYTSQ